MNILYIDDCFESYEKISHALKKRFESKIELYFTSKMSEGINLIKNKSIDLILIDYNKDQTDEFVLSKLLNYTKKVKNISVVFLSFQKFDEFEKYGFELGSVDYITKPLDMNLLLNRISLYMNIINQNKLLTYANLTLKEDLYKQMDKKRLQENILIHQGKTSVMSEMVGTIAHEWRQPLNHIGTVILNMETKNSLGIIDQKDIKRSLKKISSILFSLSNTIDNFSNFFIFSKDKKETDLVWVVQTCIDLVKKSFSYNKITFHFEYDKNEKFMVKAYLNELRQVLLNLFSNTFDALNEKELLKKENFKIKIKLYKKGEKIYLKVCDDAGGIKKSVLHKIFNPYFSTKFTKHGNGMGLYLAKIVIERFHNGSIKAYNGEKGACFLLEFKNQK